MSGSNTKIQKEILDEVLRLYEKRREEEDREVKQEEDAANRLYYQETQQEPEGKFEQKTEFYKAFSKIIGDYPTDQPVVHESQEKKASPVTQVLDEKPKQSKKLKGTKKKEEKGDKTKGDIRPSISEISSPGKKEEETKSVLGPLDKKPEQTQELKITDKKEEGIDSITRSSQISVFERLSYSKDDLKEREHDTEDPSKKLDNTLEIQKPEKQEEELDKINSSIEPSFFEMFSHGMKEEEEVEHATQEIETETNFSQELEKNEKREEKSAETEGTDRPSMFQRLSRRIKKVLIRPK